MHDLFSKFLSYIPVCWHRRWLAMAVAWVICLIGWSMVAGIPDKYESRARIYVDTNSLLRPLLAGLTVDTDPARDVLVMQRTLKSRPNLEEVIRATDLDLTVKDPIGLERLVAELKSEIIIGAERNNLFSITYKNTDPQVAKNVVQAVLTIFVESNLGASRQGMDKALRFLDDQIRNYEKQLDEAEQRLARFKHENAELLPGTAGSYHQRLIAARTVLASLDAQLADAIARRDELHRQLASVPEYIELASPRYGQGGPASRQDDPRTDLEARILELDKGIDDMLLRFTEEHPDVIAARRLQDNLRNQLDEQTRDLSVDEEDAGATGLGAADTSANKVPNQVYQEIKLQNVQVEADIATVQGQIARQKEKITKLEAAANKVPEVEMKFTKLNRDYGILKNNFLQLLARKESALMSEERDTKGEKVQFRVIEPPRVPLIPAPSRRRVYLSMVLVGAIGSGVGFGFLIGALRRTFYSTWHLSNAVDLPILGSVSMRLTAAQRRWKIFKLASFCFVLVALLGIFGGLQAAETFVGLPNAVPADVVDKAVEKLPPPVTEWWRSFGAKLSDKI